MSYLLLAPEADGDAPKIILLGLALSYVPIIKNLSLHH